MDRTASLSIAALRHSQTLPEADPALIAACLYFFNRHPISPSWKHAYPTLDAILQALDLQPDSAGSRLLSQSWQPAPIQGNSWIGWRRNGRGNTPEDLPFKLYISPTCAAFPSVFKAALPVLVNSQAVFFKIGKGVGGLMRPDKWVVYFTTPEHLCDVAGEIQQVLRGSAVQGVPFTCPLDEQGLLSWSQLPPTAIRFSNGQLASWRQWICLVAGEAIVAHRQTGGPAGEAWQAALQQLGKYGIDTQVWALAGAQKLSI